MRVKSRKALDDCATADVATPIGLDTPPSLYSPLQCNTITPFHDSHPTRGFQPIAIHLLYPNLAVFRILISLSLSRPLSISHTDSHSTPHSFSSIYSIIILIVCPNLHNYVYSVSFSLHLSIVNFSPLYAPLLSNILYSSLSFCLLSLVGVSHLSNINLFAFVRNFGPILASIL